MNNMNNYEMATPINAIKNNQVNNLVRNVENNIETLNNTSNVPPSQPMNLTYNPNIIEENKPNFSQQQPMLVRNVPNVQKNNTYQIMQPEFSRPITTQIPTQHNTKNNTFKSDKNIGESLTKLKLIWCDSEFSLRKSQLIEYL